MRMAAELCGMRSEEICSYNSSIVDRASQHPSCPPIPLADAACLVGRRRDGVVFPSRGSGSAHDVVRSVNHAGPTTCIRALNWTGTARQDAPMSTCGSVQDANGMTRTAGADSGRRDRECAGTQGSSGGAWSGPPNWPPPCKSTEMEFGGGRGG